MILRFRCKDCGQKYQVPDDYATGEFKCVECGGEMEIPESSTLHDRPAVDLGVEDERPLVNVSVKVKSAAPNNVLGSERDFIEKRASQAETIAEDAPSVDDELINGYLPPRGNAKIPARKPSLQSSTPAKAASPPGKLTPPSRGASLGEGSSLQLKASAGGKIQPPRPTTLPQFAPAAPAIKPPTEKSTVPDHYSAKNIAPGDGFCAKHPKLHATSACNSCRKPICLECRQLWGYYCSEECRDNSLSSLDRKIKADHQQENAKMDWIIRSIKIALAAVACVILGYGGLWAWKQFLDPGGKVAWVWKRPAASINFLKVKPERLVMLTGKDIITLDPQTGKVISSFNNKIFDSMHLNKILDDKLVISGGKAVALIDLQAKVQWQTLFQDPVINVNAGSEVALVTTRRWVESKKTYRTRDGVFRMPPTAITHLGAVEFKQGKILWNTLEGKSAFSIVAVGDKNYVSLGAVTVNKKNKTVLKVNDLRTRKELWQIKLPASPTMGPMLYNGNILFRIKDTLHAVSMAGKKVWSAEVQGYCSNRNFKDNDNLAFFINDSMLTVLDMNQGKVLWNNTIDARRITYVAGKLLMRVSEVDEEYSKRHKNDKAPKLPPAYEKLKKGDPVMTAMLGGNREKEVRYIHFLICLDAKTGKKLWKSKKVRGHLIVGAGRAVIFRDAIVASKLSMISSKRLGKSIVGQLDLKTGEQLFERRDDIGVTGPRIIGNKLVGYLYDRNYKDTSTTGLAGFNLR